MSTDQNRSSAADKLVPSNEAARLLSISDRTLWTWTNEGRIVCVKIGRIKRYRLSDLMKFAAAHTTRHIADRTRPERNSQ